MKPRLLLLALCFLFTLPPLPAAETWLTDYEAARSQAAREHKKLLLDFTGSDWCKYCILLEEEVLAKEAFATFAKDMVLVRLDFPRKKELPAAEKDQNTKLKAQFKIEGYPTLIVLNAEGRELHRAVGYEPGSGPTTYLTELTK